MTIESEILSALGGLVDDRVYGFITPQTVTQVPRIVYQYVGGAPINFLEGAGATLQRYRTQVNVWHATRQGALALGRAARDALAAHTVLQATIDGGLIMIYEEDTKLYGTRQDFNLFG